MAKPIETLIQKYNPKNLNEYEKALKEIIQEIALAGLSRAHFFDQAAFYGGTALRIFFGLQRFSEDLDFTLFRHNPNFKLKPYFSSIQQALESFGFSVEIESVDKPPERKIESAFLKTNTKIHLLKIDTAGALAKRLQDNQNLQIKFEVDVYPPAGFEKEVHYLLPPITASVSVLKPSSLFAGKIHAVLFRDWKTRVKGRDFYDLLWFLGRKTPLHLPYLEMKMKDGGKISPEATLTPNQVIQLLEARISRINWAQARTDIEPFLNEPKEVEIWSKELFLSAIRTLTFSTELPRNGQP